MLKAQLSSEAEPEKDRKSFGSLYGVLSGKSNSTETEIRDVQYRTNWDNNTKQ